MLREALGGLHGGKVLDVANGGGDLIKVLVRHLKSYAEIVGVDGLEYTDGMTPNKTFARQALLDLVAWSPGIA